MKNYVSFQVKRLISVMERLMTCVKRNGLVIGVFAIATVYGWMAADMQFNVLTVKLIIVFNVIVYVELWILYLPEADKPLLPTPAQLFRHFQE